MYGLAGISSLDFDSYSCRTNLFLADGCEVSIGTGAPGNSNTWAKPTIVLAELKGLEADVSLRKHSGLEIGKRTILRKLETMTFCACSVTTQHTNQAAHTTVQTQLMTTILIE